MNNTVLKIWLKEKNCIHSLKSAQARNPRDLTWRGTVQTHMWLNPHKNNSSSQTYIYIGVLRLLPSSSCHSIGTVSTAKNPYWIYTAVIWNGHLLKRKWLNSLQLLKYRLHKYGLNYRIENKRIIELIFLMSSTGFTL